MKLAAAAAIIAQKSAVWAAEESWHETVRNVGVQQIQRSLQEMTGRKNGKLLRRARENYRRRMFEFSPAEECDPASSDPSADAPFCRSGTYCIRDERSNLGGYCTRLSPNLFLNDQTIPECDPTSTDADIGILSCGSDKVCVQSDASSRGGVCIVADAQMITSTILKDTLNRGYVYCDESSPYYGMLDCECSGFDQESKSGSFTCNYSYCFDNISECCTGTCADITLTYSSDGSTSYIYETCYSFNQPYGQTFCYGRNADVATGKTCFGSFDGTTCDTCALESTSCTRFDCSGAGLGDDFCLEEFYPPVLTSCYADCVTCSLCPDGTVTNTDQRIGFTDFTCAYVNYVGSLGMWGGSRSTECMNVRNAVQDSCCATVSEAPADPEAPEVSNTDAPRGDSSGEGASSDSETEAPTLRSTTSVPEPTPTATEAPADDVSLFPPTDAPAMTCSIRIQTSRCEELLIAQAGKIPCSCQGKCIAFINDEFEKCDDGRSIAGSGTIVAGCTFDMIKKEDFVCDAWAESNRGVSAASTLTGTVLSMLSIPLLTWFMSGSL